MIDKSFPVRNRMKLNCRFHSGALLVQAQDGLSQARVRISSADGDDDRLSDFTVDCDGDTITVHEHRDRAGGWLDLFRWGSRAEVRIEVELPSQAELNLGVHSADLVVRGRVGTTEIGCGSSSVRLGEVAGELRLRSGSGNVTVDRVHGSANLRGGSGEIRIGEAGADVTVGMGSGRLAIGTAHGKVRMRSGSGGTVIELAEADVDITSGAGPVSIGLGTGQPARLDVLTGSGQLHTEMPVADRQPAGAGAHPIIIRARTGAGDVTIRRAG